MAGTEINANEIVAKLAVEAASQTIRGVSKPVLDRARRALQTVMDAYGPYLEATFQRVRNVKTFLRPNEPVELLDVFVPANLSFADEKLDASVLVERANSRGRVVITGVAGRGKSILMRHTAISMYYAPQGKIPLFLELRAINAISSKDILQYVHAQYKGRGNVKFEDFEIALERGYFSLLLDGFDEIDPSSREIIEEQILEISYKFPLVPILVSSRPDPRFQKWQDFQELQVSPLSLAQARDLVRRANYDVDVTDTFLRRLTPDFYNKHDSFLSNPLLIIMMMLTFEDYAEIPTSLHAFYKNAFDTLIRRHDATKPKFVRKMHSSCTAEQFQQIFSSFCLLTYSKFTFEFSEGQAEQFIKASLRQQQIPADPKLVLNDLIESICLLQREGFEVSFVHRSFQEYFCALFLSTSAAGLVRQFLETGRFRTWDDMLKMLYGMARDRVEQEWAVDVVTNIIDQYSNENIIEYIKDRYGELSFFNAGDGEASIHATDTVLSRRISILERLYGEHFASTRLLYPHRTINERQKILYQELIKREQAGDERLLGFAASRREGFVLNLISGDQEILNIYNLIEYSSQEISALKLVREEQNERRREEDAFLSAVFGEASV